MPKTSSTFFELFENPSHEYRGKPFWSWNGKLDPDELRRQVRILHRMGMGGGFLHSRVGLATEYLGKDWFDCIRASVDECKKLGMEAWLYDEDRWPSGSAGGLVTRDPKYRLRFLAMEVRPPELFEGHEGLLGVWQARIPESGRATGLRRLNKGEKPRKGKDLKVLCIKAIPMPQNSWYNGYTYLDVLSPEAVDRFIEVTHEAYKKEIGEEFGKGVLGIFTDEPNYGFVWPFNFDLPEEVHLAVNPWTPKFREIFKAEYGYDLIPHLPELFLDVEGVELSQARYQYRALATRLFVESFSKRIGKWCEKNRIALTGHVLLEGNMRASTMVVGSTMPFYEYMQVPGIDILSEHSYEYDTAKQTVSVTRQMGRKWVLSELYGCTGWDFSMEGPQAVGDWQTALGVNLRCHHLSWYTMKGEAKRDYPASIFFQSAWWEHYSAVEDYFSRVHVALTEGDAVRRILVIHPIESMWVKFRPPCIGKGGVADVFNERNADVRELDEMLPTLRNWLLEAHLDFDYGDEALLAKHGSVITSKDGASLRMAKVGYDTVLVPPGITIRTSTLKLLKRFQAAGGTVVFSGEVARAVDGAPSREAAELAAKCQRVAFNRGAVVKAVEDTREVSLTDSKNKAIPSLLYMLRESDERRVLFFGNTDRKKGYEKVEVWLQGQGTVVELDPMTGAKTIVSSSKGDGWVSFSTSIAPTGSRLFTLEKQKPAGLKAQKELKELRKQTLHLEPGAQLCEENVLVLDRPTYQIGDGKIQGPAEILRVDSAVRDTLGVPHRGGEMLQPWARPKEKNPPTVPLTLTYTFQVRALPSGPLYLALENSNRFTIAINGKPVPVDESGAGWWVDPCLAKVCLDPTLLHVGKNEVTLTTDFTPEDELEAMFLLGSFGVSVKGTECELVQPTQALKLGSWVKQGLPFYGGAVTYRFKMKGAPAKGERAFLSAPNFRGAMGRVLVNGEQAGYLLWPPYEVDITDLLKKTGNEIALQVIGSRRNTFGPLHEKNPNPWAVGPGNFVTMGEDWSEEYVLKPCGLMEAPVVVVKK